MSPLILNKGLHFCYNPFGGIADSELPQVIVPHSFTEAIHRLIQKPATTQIGDARIYWQLVAKVDTTFGLTFNYKTEFTVTKEKSIT